MNENAEHREEGKVRSEESQHESTAEERTSANEELAEQFGDTEAHQTRLERVSEEEGEKVEEHDDDREATAEEKANNIQNDGVIVHGGG